MTSKEEDVRWQDPGRKRKGQRKLILFLGGIKGKGRPLALVDSKEGERVAKGDLKNQGGVDESAEKNRMHIRPHDRKFTDQALKKISVQWSRKD